MTGRKVPCATCPWRKSSTAGGADIPGFSLCKMQGLADTVGSGDAFRTIMACHYSGEPGTETPCVGYVAQVGWSNLNVRIMAMRDRGDIDWEEVWDACAELDLWETFEDMLAAYEEALEACE